MRTIQQGIYKHFKGGEYDVIGVAVHSETGEELVLYRPRYGNRSYTVRPYDMFTDHVQKGDYDGPRFELIVSNETGLI